MGVMRSPVKMRRRTVEKAVTSPVDMATGIMTGLNKVPDTIEELHANDRRRQQEHEILLRELRSNDDRRTREHLERLRKLDQLIEDGKRRVATIAKGDPGRPGSDAPPVDEEKIIERVHKKIRVPKDADPVDTDQIVQEVIDEVVKRLPKQEQQKAVSSDEVLNLFLEKIKDKKIRPEQWEGLQQSFSTLRSQITSKGYLHGSGITGLTASTNITLEPDGKGGYIISASGGTATIYSDDVSGTINSSNKVFTVPNTITTALALYLANSIYQPGVDFTVTGPEQITMTAAPDASLAGQPFWLSHT